MAFPPTVTEATTALIINCKSTDKLYIEPIFNAIKALIEPLKTPQISPTISEPKLATFAELRISFTEVFAPVTLLLALA